MRLTKSDRDAFVAAVLDDVPQIDYDEQCRSKVMAWAMSRMPEDLRAVYAKYPGWFENNHVYTPGSLSSVYAPVLAGSGDIAVADPDFYAVLVQLSNDKREQRSKLVKLEQELRGVISTCSTLKKAKELLPEFTKYLPTDRDGITDRSMPVISNLVSSLMDAGWPKDQPFAAQ